jgi:kynurenine formamidase
MTRRIIDLGLTVEDNMPAHKRFQSPVYLKAMTHEPTLSCGLGLPEGPMTFQTNDIGKLDHVGTHVDAFLHVNPKGLSVDQMPLDLRHIGDLEDPPPIM